METQNTVLQSGTWGFPIPIHYGPGSIKNLGSIARGAEIDCPLVVSDSGTAGLPFMAEIMEYLTTAGLSPHLFSSFSPNPTDTECLAGGEFYRQHGCDGVIAVGGGSSLDAGKGISLFAPQDQLDFWAFDLETDPVAPGSHAPFAPLICVPTTSGTGAEVEPSAMITHTTRRGKRVIFHPDHQPHAAVLDSELTIGLPANLTAWTGIDAIVHAIEAYLVPDFHPMCDGIALQALSLMAPAIKRAYHDGGDLEARSAMMVGSCLAAVSFTKGLGLVHAVSHMVGGLYNTQHGLTNAVILPAALQYNRPVIEDKAVELARACGAKSHDFDGLLDWILDLHQEFDIPHGLAELGVQRDNLDQQVELALSDVCRATNPRTINREEMVEFISNAIEKTW